MNASLANFIIYASATELKSQLPPGIDLNDFDEYGYTPLIQTAIVNDVEKARVILDAGADVNLADLTGRTALHWAVDNDNHDLVQLLLERQADPNVYTIASQSVMVKPFLRNNEKMKDRLLNAGIDLDFTKDYVNFKLIGHRFQLRGFVDIVDPNGKFTELTYEGFILEFSLGAIRQSLADYCQNYAAKRMQTHFDFIEELVGIFDNAITLASFQHYLLKVEEKRNEIMSILKNDSLILPVGQDGHAITIIKHHNLLALCDRQQKQDPSQPSVKIFYNNRPSRITPELLTALLYKRQKLEDIEKILVTELSLQPLQSLHINKQVTGNCSWANVEACLPTFMIMKSIYLNEKGFNLMETVEQAQRLYYHWQEWDKGRALQFCIKGYPEAHAARQAAVVTVLAAVFVQACQASLPLDQGRAQLIFPFLKIPQFAYVLESYIKIYCGYRKTDIGDNLKKLLQLCDDLDEFS